jgi:hypothetical protein
MERKSRFLALACQTLAAASVIASTEAAAQAPKKVVEEVECFGIHGCKGKNDCGVGQTQIDLANKVFNNKFTSSKTFDCKGNALGSHDEKHLAWVTVKGGKAECFKKGGFIFSNTADKKLQIEDKSGVKS